MGFFKQGDGHPFSLRLNLRLLVLSCVLPATLVSALLLYDSFHLERENVQHQTALLAQAAMADLDRDIAGMESALKTLATSPELATGDLRSFHERARQALPSGIVYNYLLTDAQGRQVLNTLRPFGSALPTTGTPAQLAAVFERGITVLTDFFIGPVTGKPAIAMGVPVMVGNEVRYSLNIGLSPDRIQQLVASHPLPDGWLLAVLDRSGTIVGRSRDVERYLGQKAVPELQAAVSKGQSGALTTTTKEGTQVFTSYAVSRPWGWSVVVGAPTALLHESLMERLLQLGVGILCAVGLGLWIARTVVGRVMSSVTGLNGAALALVNGDPVELPRLQLVEAQAVGQAIERAAQVMQQVKFMAQHDALTLLPNRVLFEDFAARRMALAQRQGKPLIVMAVDLDGFKGVNDTLGHAKGDEVLKAAARRLSDAVRASDLVARIGGDEFLLLVYDLQVEAAVDLAARVVALLTEPYEGVTVPVSASVGVAVFKGPPETLPELCGRADQALYQAKQEGKGRATLAADPLG